MSSILAAGLISFAVIPAANAAPVPPVDDGDSVYIGPVYHAPVEPGSTITFPIYTLPVDPDNLGDPDYWAYCLEQTVSARGDREGTVGSIGSFVGTNFFATNTESQAKVLWVLANGYPSLSLADFSARAGVTLTRDEAINAVTTAIWRFTGFAPDPGNNANFYWASANAEAASRYLVNGAHTSGGITPSFFETTVSVTPPAGAQIADSLVGPFTVATNQPTATVSVDPVVPITDATGALIDASAVVDGQEIYLDLRGTTIAGSATVTAAALGSSATGKVVTVPNEDGGHWQSMILVAPVGSETTADASAQWAGLPVPAIRTSLVDNADNDKVLSWQGGTLVDTVSYVDLTPGETYRIEGELMRKSDGSATGITAEAVFTPSEATGTTTVEFIVPSGYAGQVLVAFERLFVGESVEPLAVHEDIEDAEQTVSVGTRPAASSAGTTLANTGVNPILPAGLAALLAVAGGVALAVQRRRA